MQIACKFINSLKFLTARPNKKETKKISDITSMELLI